MVTVRLWRVVLLFPMSVMVVSHGRHSDTEPACSTAGGPCRGSDEVECNDSNGWKLRGSDWGCCGNYDGCCTYASLICYFHDAFCRCCDVGKSFCGPTCQPEKDCFSGNSKTDAARVESEDNNPVSSATDRESAAYPSDVSEHDYQREEPLFTEETGSGDMSVTVVL